VTEIFYDKELKIRLDNNILIEGKDYYINLTDYVSVTIKKWINDEHLEKFVDYIPQNPILKLRFDNVVGFVTILGNQFDVRSEKLFDGNTGVEQFKMLLDEIIKFSNKLTFNFKGASFGKGKSLSNYSLSDIETLDYYYQLAFNYPSNQNLKSFLSQCFSNPNSEMKQTFQSVPFYRSKVVPNSFYSHIANLSDFSKIDIHHSLSSSSLANKMNRKRGRYLLPNKVTNIKHDITFNTKENQFLKFFLEEIRTICLRLLYSVNDSEIKTKAKELRDLVNHYLQNPFFKGISKLCYLPGSSSVLLKKSGYREIFHHYIQSKLSFRPLLEEQKLILHNTRLKSIDKLYEIWVFYKIANTIFSSQLIRETYNGKKLRNGSFIESYTWESNQVKLHYNKTFSRSRQSSYSVILKPDISLEFGSNCFYLFDAKYKFKQVPDEDTEDELTRLVKNEDIHKMHAYLDAIPNAKTAIVLYPGSEIVFYDKSNTVYDRPFEILGKAGVGAVPLVPNENNELPTLFNSIIE